MVPVWSLRCETEFGCDSIINVRYSNSYYFMDFPTLMFSESLILSLLSLQNTMSGNTLCQSYNCSWPSLPPKQLLANPLTWKTSSCSHLGIGFQQRAGGWGSALWESRRFCGKFCWYNVSYVHSSPGPGLSEVYMTANLPRLFLFHILLWARRVDLCFCIYL